MPEHLKYGGTTLWTEASTSVAIRGEKDLNGRTHVIEALGDISTNLFRSSKRDNRSYTVVADLLVQGAVSGNALRVLKQAWEEAHPSLGGLRVVERETATGVYYLDAIAQTPQWGEEHGPAWAEVTQEYLAPTPLWYGPETHASANFNGATPVTLTCVNAGNVDAWIRIVVNGAVEAPKIAATDWEIEFALIALAQGDELAISTKTPATAWYTPAGGAAAIAYGYRTDATSFRLARLPSGSTDLTLTASAGAELIANTGFETAGAAPPTFLNWTELLTHGSVNDEAADVHGGSHAAKLISTAADNDHYVFQTFVVVPGEKYLWTFWTHGDGVNDGLYGARDLTNGAWIIDRTTTHTGVTGAVYTQVTVTVTIPAGCISLRLYLGGTGVNAGVTYYDDVSLTNLALCTVYWRPYYEALP